MLLVMHGIVITVYGFNETMECFAQTAVQNKAAACRPKCRVRNAKEMKGTRDEGGGMRKGAECDGRGRRGMRGGNEDGNKNYLAKKGRE